MSQKDVIDQLCLRMTLETAQLVVARATDIQQQLGLTQKQRDSIARMMGDLVSDVVAKTAEVFKEAEKEAQR